MKIFAGVNCEQVLKLFLCTMFTKISEKSDGYVDSLRVGLEVWEKQLMLGGDLEVWADAKLTLFAESHPFSSEKEVFEVKVWKSAS